MRHSLALLALSAAGCLAPDQFDPAAYQTVQVAFGPSLDAVPEDWRADQLPYLRREVAELRHLGPDWRVVGEDTAGVVVRPFDSGPGCAHGAGRFTPGTHYVEVDPACAGGYDALARAVGHELVHYYTYWRWHWAGHICVHPNDHDRSQDGCSQAVQCADCLLSPGLALPNDGPSTDELWAPVSDPTPQIPDLELFAYCQAHGSCR